VDVSGQSEQREIQGLKFFVEGQELADHLGVRATYHLDKRAWCEGAIADLEAGGLTRSAATGDPIEALAKKRDHHAKKAERLEFMRLHVALGTRYLLSDGDLESVELISGKYE
jgi:hypothetical protein